MDTLYAVDEAAKKLNVSSNTVRAWLSRERLRRTKVGRRTMVSESELQRFIVASGAAAAERPRERAIA
jgi:excisionase family DNA binding protein